MVASTNRWADGGRITSDDGPAGRRRGSIRQRGTSLQVRVFAGSDPVTGRDRYLSETVRGTDKAARRRAERTMTRLLADVDKQRAPETSIALSRVLDEWLRTVEIEDTTRRTYVGYIERTVKPAIGSVGIDKLSARTLETLCASLRRCRAQCSGRPFIERHATASPHDCGTSGRVPHVCKPMAAATVRQIHSMISGALSAAVRWDWIGSNVARVAQRSKAKAPEPDPPSPDDVARMLDAAFALDDEWGTLVWLVMMSLAPGTGHAT